MYRSLFLRIAGVFHVLLGVSFFAFTREATVLMIAVPGPHMHMLVKGLSGIVMAFGGMSLLVHRAPNGPAFTAILGGTLFYLLFTVVCDICWLFSGLLLPIAWVSIALRTLLAAGYAYYLLRMAQDPDVGQRRRSQQR